MSLTFPITESALRWLEVLLSECFGHTWTLARFEDGLRLKIAGTEGNFVFDSLCQGFTGANSDMPCTQWTAEREGWHSVLGKPLPAPGIKKLPSPLIEQRGADFYIHYDILGLTYWMLARVEEIGRTDLDNHGRFPATSSHAFKHGYLERPVVDEWMHLFGQVIQRQWPSLALKVHTYSIKVSHDVDRPTRYGFASSINLIRRMVGDVSRGNVGRAILAPWIRFNTKKQLHPADPFNTFDWLMDQSEAHGLVSAFYFICNKTSNIDGEYDISHPAMRNLLKRIHKRGHEIGLHPSYNTYLDPQELTAEAQRLYHVCAEETVKQDSWGGRMHYLRWQHPITLYAMFEAGMSYDTTFGYADNVGFRCGTCNEYFSFDPVEQRTVKLRIRPLVAMECSLLEKKYMGLSTEETLKKIFELKKVCSIVRGQFTLLWHNSELAKKHLRDIYQAIL
jgi:hypothetical protein